MPSARQKFFVGLFVIIAGALILLFMLLLGLSDFFHDGNRYAAYFRESVRGLNPGAEVAFRGVEVGRVESIRLAPDGDLVEVIVIIDSSITKPAELVATIRSLGITGIMYVELDRPGPGEIVDLPDMDFEPTYPVFATRPSVMARMIDSAEKIISEIGELPIMEIATGIESTVKNLDRAITDARIGETSDSIRELVEKSREVLDVEKWDEIRISMLEASENLERLMRQSSDTVARVDTFLEENTESAAQTLREAEKAVAGASAFMDRIAGIADDADKQIDWYDQRLALIVEDLRQAAGGLNRLMDRLENDPSQLLFGRPVPPKPIDK